jgi:hypothetical protein
LLLCRNSLLDETYGFKGTRSEGLTFTVEHLSWKRLPKSVIDSLGGFEAVKAKRAAIVAAQTPAPPAGQAPPTETAAVTGDVGGDGSAAPGSALKSRKRTKSDDSVNGATTVAPAAAEGETVIKQEAEKIRCLLPPHVMDAATYAAEFGNRSNGSGDGQSLKRRSILSPIPGMENVQYVPKRITSVVWQCLN